jgi:hypothetical protein
MRGLMVFLSWFHQALSQNIQVRSNIIQGVEILPPSQDLLPNNDFFDHWPIYPLFSQTRL